MQSWFVTYRKKLEEVHFVEEEFLHKKVNKNGINMRIMASYRRYSRSTCSYGSLSQALWRFDSIELKEVTKVLQLCCSQASRLVLTSLFCFLFGFGEVEDLMLDFGFFSNLPASSTWSGLVGR